jgi:hypothetical protein
MGCGGGRLEALVGFALPVAVAALALPVPLPLLVAACHLLVLLDGTMALFHFAVSVVRRCAAATVGVLTVHASLEEGY